jgi:hypothetical protein
MRSITPEAGKSLGLNRDKPAVLDHGFTAAARYAKGAKSRDAPP